jgi:hypothetical protein
MNSLIKCGLAAAMLFLTAMATPALAKKSFDICVDPATDVATQDTFTRGAFLTVAANIYPSGTIESGGGTPCSSLDSSLVIGTFYANVGLEVGLPAATDVFAFVTWHFDFSSLGNGTFVTVGPIPFPPGAGGPETFPQTISGASGPFPGRGTAIVTALSPDGFQFRITIPSNGK